ncbi:Uncharacterized protein Fot_53712 [Forsythia ovata]|uniref:Uncharacterized protein n=1 Tax=Forsythia ovata TaxID=205694 RepID=A0ABD1PF28_9LAMI
MYEFQFYERCNMDWSWAGLVTGQVPVLTPLNACTELFNWMQNKINRKPNKPPCTHKPQLQGLLATGTFGNTQNPDSEILSSPNLQEFGNPQKELTKLVSTKPAQELISDTPLDTFLNCPSTLDVDSTISNRFSTNSDDKDEDIERTIRIILARCKDVCENKRKKVIGEKSISFLVIKKMFVCTTGFVPTPSLRDTFHESRMEKLLRTILTNKIYPQNSSQALSMKNAEKEDETRNGHKWVKTDSECKYYSRDLVRPSYVGMNTKEKEKTKPPNPSSVNIDHFSKAKKGGGYLQRQESLKMSPDTELEDH